MTSASASESGSAEWLIRPVVRPEARTRLFCFPFAGGAASAYRLWPSGLPHSVEVCALAYPARAHRLREPPIDQVPVLVDVIVAAILPSLDKPFCFFGHSMGAVIATEVARKLEALGTRLPDHLFVSGRRPPHMPGSETPLHPLPDDEFVAELNRRYGGVPAEVLEHKDLLALLLPGLRADLKALETHFPAQRAPLQFGITAFGGMADPLTPREHLDAWRGETSSGFRVRQFEGDHFYIDPSRDALLTDISATLLDAAQGASDRTVMVA